MVEPFVILVLAIRHYTVDGPENGFHRFHFFYEEIGASGYPETRAKLLYVPPSHFERVNNVKLITKFDVSPYI